MIFVSCLSFATLLRGLGLGDSLPEDSCRLAVSMIRVEFAGKASKAKQPIPFLVSRFDQA